MPPKNKEDVRVSKVSALLGVSLSLFAILYGFLKYAVQPEHISSSINFGVVPHVTFLTKLLMVILLIYIVALFILSFIRLYDPENKKKEGIFKFREKFINLVYNAPFDFFGIVWIFLVVYLVVFVFTMFNGLLAWISWGIIFLFLVSNMLRHFVRREGLKNVFKRFCNFFGIFIIIMSIYLIVNLILLFTSNVDIVLDKEQYFLGDDVYVKIFTTGLFKEPELREVYYSSNLILLENRTDDFKFKSSPILVKINSSDLTNITANSYVLVGYNYGWGFGVLPTPNLHVKMRFVPFFSYNKTNFNQVTSLEIQCVSNEISNQAPQIINVSVLSNKRDNSIKIC